MQLAHFKHLPSQRVTSWFLQIQRMAIKIEHTHLPNYTHSLCQSPLSILQNLLFLIITLIFLNVIKIKSKNVESFQTCSLNYHPTFFYLGRWYLGDGTWGMGQCFTLFLERISFCNCIEFILCHQLGHVGCFHLGISWWRLLFVSVPGNFSSKLSSFISVSI